MPRLRRYTARKRTVKRRVIRRRKIPKSSKKVIRRPFMGNAPTELTIFKGLGFPARLRMKMRCVEQFSMVAVANVTNNLIVANSIYRPFYTNNDTRDVQYFDQLSDVYQSWKVIGSKITVIFEPSNANTALHCALYVGDASYSTWTTLIEQGMIRKPIVIGGTANKNTNQTLTANWSLKQRYKDMYNDSSLCGDFSNRPSLQDYYILAIQPQDTTSTVGTYVTAAVDYIVDFFDKYPTGGS